MRGQGFSRLHEKHNINRASGASLADICAAWRNARRDQVLITDNCKLQYIVNFLAYGLPFIYEVRNALERMNYNTKSTFLITLPPSWIEPEVIGAYKLQ